METNKDILKNTDYQVPEDYFIDFQERLQAQIEFEDIVGTKNVSGFIVPKDYFTNFPKKVRLQEHASIKVVSLFKTKWIYAAASVAAIIVLLFMLRSSNTLLIDDLENDTIASYLESENNGLSIYDLEELLTDEELDNLSNTIELEDEELLEYLDITTDPYDLMIQ